MKADVENICEKKECTMCGACSNICPRNCLKAQYDHNSWYMVRDMKKCIACGLCERVCPNLNMIVKNCPEHAYAAWNTNDKTRCTSASGGVAAALYQYAKNNNMFFAGVLMNEIFEAHYYLTNDLSFLQEFQNSKYTYSFMDDIYIQIQEKLQMGNGVLFVGLPCQVAALKTYLITTKTKIDKLILVDIICHGTPIPSYIKDHIAAIQKESGRNYDKCFFRDPKYKTSNFVFTLYENSSEKEAYKKNVESTDLYQIGYHNGWIYRECCYQCHYAETRRVGDITIGDYHGLGKMGKYTADQENVSVVFSNTQKGYEILNNLLLEKLIVLHERPVEEPILYEPQLNHPSVGGKKHSELVEAYELKGDFEKAAAIVFRYKVKKNQIKSFLHVKRIKSFIRQVLSNEC